MAEMKRENIRAGILAMLGALKDGRASAADVQDVLAEFFPIAPAADLSALPKRPDSKEYRGDGAWEDYRDALEGYADALERALGIAAEEEAEPKALPRHGT